MADDLKYGYKGAEPTQSQSSNTGVFDPADINNLIANNKWTPQLGQLELIQTQTVSGTPSTLVFNDLQTNKYDIHFMTISNFKPQTDNRHLALRYQVDGTTTTGFDYKYAKQRQTAATSSELKIGNDSKIWLAYNCSIGLNSLNGYIIFYNLKSSYAFINTHFYQIDKDNNISTNFQTAVRDEVGGVDGIEFATSGGNLEHGLFSLYGIRSWE
jgi:hypothetical protein